MTALPADLQKVLDDIEAADRAAEALAAACTDEQFHWQPRGGEGWSIAQCLDHLATINAFYVKSIRTGVDQAKATLAKAYDVAEAHLSEREWVAADAFTMADCAAAPGLFYANLILPFADHPNLAAYFTRLVARPSFARAIDEARPYHHLFPLGMPPDYP